MPDREDVAPPHGAGPLSLDAFVVSLEGEFDLAERHRLLDAFALAAEAPVVVLDFEKTRYVDSTVLDCLVGLQQDVAARGGRLVVAGLGPAVRRLFEICDLERVFEVHEQLRGAIAGLDLDPARVRRLTIAVERGAPPEPIEILRGSSG